MIKYYDALVSDISDISQPSAARAVFAERLPSLFQYLHSRRLYIRSRAQCARAFNSTAKLFRDINTKYIFSFSTKGELFEV